MVRDYWGMEEDSSRNQGSRRNVALEKKISPYFYTHILCPCIEVLQRRANWPPDPFNIVHRCSWQSTVTAGSTLEWPVSVTLLSKTFTVSGAHS